MRVAAASVPAVREVDVTAAFQEHYRFVWRVLTCAGVPRSMLDDAVQDVFLTLHRRRRDYDGRAPMRHWLYGIARGVGRNYGRKALRAAKRQDELPSLSQRAPQEEAVAREQAAGAVEAFLEALNPEQREVFVLVHVESMPAPEIADMLGIGVNTVYSRLRLARKRFEALAARMRARDEREQREHERGRAG